MGGSELGEGTGLTCTFSDSILARSDFCSFRGEDRGPRLVAYLEEIVHPLPTYVPGNCGMVEIGLRPVLGVGPVSLGADPACQAYVAGGGWGPSLGPSELTYTQPV